MMGQVSLDQLEQQYDVLPAWARARLAPHPVSLPHPKARSHATKFRVVQDDGWFRVLTTHHSGRRWRTTGFWPTRQLALRNLRWWMDQWATVAQIEASPDWEELPPEERRPWERPISSNNQSLPELG